MNSPKQGVSDLPEICYRHGMRSVVISPGSRNAPLIFSFTSHRLMECFSITDERCAAYFALGLAAQTRQPVGLICTSGTALLNFAPAIAEACYQNIALIILTADRPGEWIDQADGQTIRQREIYRNYIKKSFELPAETDNDSDLWYFNRSVNTAMNTALLEPRGPVHLNIPLREPLYNELPKPSEELRIIQTVGTPAVLTGELFMQLLVRWNSCMKKMIIFGADEGNETWSKIIPLISDNPALVIIAENISNLCNEKIIASPERFFGSVNEEEAVGFQPDLLITVGNSVVSAQLKKYLRQYSPLEHWHIQSSASFVDTFQGLTHTIVASPEPLLRALIDNEIDSISDYRNLFLDKELRMRERHNELITSFPYSDLMVFNEILKLIPLGSNLHLANSTPIRYSQFFQSRGDLRYHCNRGTSGIDGCISTAAGFSVASSQSTILITGDLSFIYDSNGLWNKYLKGNFKIIVMNNGGGNIFRLINSGQGSTSAREYFETPHHVNISLLAGAFGANHAICQSKMELSGLLEWFFAKADHPNILEIVTDPDLNTTVFKDYYKKMK